MQGARLLLTAIGYYFATVIYSECPFFVLFFLFSFPAQRTAASQSWRSRVRARQIFPQKVEARKYENSPKA
jgi:hypothetical protein